MLRFELWLSEKAYKAFKRDKFHLSARLYKVANWLLKRDMAATDRLIEKLASRISFFQEDFDETKDY